ncbi:unnamed protein product [Rotaria sordida]|uniref:SprT-like domain-containing protein n=1 Tax=Rotaria sordida TaxID=392033 RepID=A0A814D8X0_9BILA|nr:unnamed protein product [Rotaria sordida]CAF1376127.1 unnamed protein product [Rotaria sordida]
MLKHIVHSYHGKLHTFDDFYRDNTNPIKSRLSSNDLTSTNNSFSSSSASSPTSPCSPNSNPYSFYNIFSDFKHSTTTDVLPEEDETEEDNEIIEEESNSTPAVFYLEEEQHNQPQISSSSSSTSNWPSSILNRFRHSNNNHSMVKQNSISENQMNLTKSRKNDFIDTSINKHRFLKRSATINHTNGLIDKKLSTNDNFPELSFSTTNDTVKKHRSFGSLFNYFHHHHHNHNHNQNLTTKNSDKSYITDTLNIENLNLNTNDFLRSKIIKQKSLPLSNDIYIPVNKSPPKPILPKLASLFHRSSFEQHKYRVGNLKARLHHRRHSPPLTNNAPKFQCQDSNELIQEIKRSECQQHHDNDHMPCRRPVKPVIMKRVHTWHNTFDLRPVDQDSLKNRRTNHSSDDDQAFEKFLQEHRTPKQVKSKEKSPIQQRRKNRNSLKDFICDSSSSSDDGDEHPLEFYPKVNRLIDHDLSWRKIDDDYASDESSQSSSSSSSSENDSRLITKKKNRQISVTFLESLSKYVPIEDKHIDTKQYFTRSGFKNKKKREELAQKLFSIFDQDVFSSKLSNKITIVWSGRLTSTAGHCATQYSAQTATITLSNKVCNSPERCRDTLLHEMCHAAVSLIDGVKDGGHGPVWRKWTRQAERCYPYLPAISVKHTYDITYKFIYRCTQCQYEIYRHSKSVDIEIDFCGKCMGKFQLLLNNNQTNEVATPKKTLTRYNLFIKEHFQTMKQTQPHLSTPQLMKHLSQEYRKKMQQQNDIDLPDLEQLKI